MTTTERGNPPVLLCAPGRSLRFRETCELMPAENSSHFNSDRELAILLERELAILRERERERENQPAWWVPEVTVLLPVKLLLLLGWLWPRGRTVGESCSFTEDCGQRERCRRQVHVSVLEARCLCKRRLKSAVLCVVRRFPPP